MVSPFLLLLRTEHERDACIDVGCLLNSRRDKVNERASSPGTDRVLSVSPRREQEKPGFSIMGGAQTTAQCLSFIGPDLSDWRRGTVDDFLLFCGVVTIIFSYVYSENVNVFKGEQNFCQKFTEDATFYKIFQRFNFYNFYQELLQGMDTSCGFSSRSQNWKDLITLPLE